MAPSVLTAVVVLISAVLLTAVPSPASAAPAGPLVSLITGGTSSNVFISGQTVSVRVGPNRILKPGTHLVMEECATDFVGRRWISNQCDPRTVQIHPFIVTRDGSANYSAYPIFALPDAFTLHEPTWHRPKCDLDHACLVLIGATGCDLDAIGQGVSSQTFYVDPDTDPGNGTPEVPYVVALPLLASGIIGAYALFRRRRSRFTTPTG
jgi:hypothetical protein